MIPNRTRHIVLFAASGLLIICAVAIFTHERTTYAQSGDAQVPAEPSAGEVPASSAGQHEAGSDQATVPCLSPDALVLPASTRRPATSSGALEPNLSGKQTTSFRLCSPPDPQIAPAIEQLIAGRSFSVALSAGNGDCAELTVTVQPGRISSGQGVTYVSSGRFSVAIISENGATRVNIGAV